MNHRQAHAGPRRQRGAVAVMVAISLLALVSAVFLAIEVARVYQAHRELKKLAGMAALDAARVVSGCADENGQSGGGLSALNRAVQASLKANNPGGEPISVKITPGVIRSNRNLPSSDPGSNTRVLEPTSIGAAQAVRVTLTRPFPTPMLPFLFGNQNRRMSASATAVQEALGSFYLGTTLASLQGGLVNDLLGALLCPLGPVGNTCRSQVLNLKLLDSNKGLASLNVSLDNLLLGAVRLGLNVRDVSELLDLQLTLPQWLGVLGYGLEQAVGGTVGQVGSGVGGLIRGLAGSTDATRTFSLSSLLNVTGDLLNPAVSGVLGALPVVNGQELLLALGQAAKADPSGSLQPIALPVQVGLGNLLQVYIFLQILQPPKFAVGRATGTPPAWNGSAAMSDCSYDGEYTCAQSSQIRLKVRAGINDQVLGLLKLRLGIDLDVGAGVAYLDSLECPSLRQPRPVAHLTAMPSLGVLGVGPYVGEPQNAKNAPALYNLPGGPSASRPYLLQLFPDQGLLGGIGWLLGWLLGDLTTSVALNAPLEVPLSTPRFQDLDPIDDFQLATPKTSHDTPLYLAYGQSGLPASDSNPQTVGSAGLLDSLTGGLLTGLACGSLNGSCNLNSPPNLYVSGPAWQNNSANLLTLVLKGLAELLNRVVTPLLTGILGILDFLLAPLLQLLDAVLEGLLQLLGVELGSLTVNMDSVSIDQPHIVTLDDE